MSFFQHQTFLEKYHTIKVQTRKRKLLIEYLATLSDSDKKALLWQLRLAPKTVEKLLAIK
jgi:hypothetical protein